MGTVGTAVAIAGVAYLVGSIPAAYIVGRMVSGVDMRVAGEGNVGARNTYHVVGRGWGVAVCLIDAAKGGAVAVALRDRPTWQLMLSAVMLAIVAGLLVWMRRLDRRWPVVALGLIVGGAIGNVVDRLRLRFVFDFLDFYWNGYHFAAFNLADSAITVGVAMLAIDGLFGGAEPAKKAPNEEVVMRSSACVCLVAIGAVLALGGCSSGTPQPLGMTQGSPDESQALAHMPLTVPPDYNLRPGATGPQDGTAAAPAQTPPSADNGGTAPATGDTASGPAQSAGEVALLQNAGAAGIDPGIRSQIDTETAAQVERDPVLISRLVLWRTTEPASQTPIITVRK